MTTINKTNYPSVIVEELKDLPEHYLDTYSDDFLLLIAALRVHGFLIFRADEALEFVDRGQDLWREMSRPSVDVYSPSVSQLRDALRKATRGSPEHKEYSNQLIRTNLLVQQRLLVFLEEFYAKRNPSFFSRLIVETVELGESCLRSQGGDIRIILGDKEQQRSWLKESQAEFLLFAKFLCSKLESA